MGGRGWLGGHRIVTPSGGPVLQRGVEDRRRARQVLNGDRLGMWSRRRRPHHSNHSSRKLAPRYNLRHTRNSRKFRVVTPLPTAQSRPLSSACRLCDVVWCRGVAVRAGATSHCGWNVDRPARSRVDRPTGGGAGNRSDATRVLSDRWHVGMVSSAWPGFWRCGRGAQESHTQPDPRWSRGE
jgi:hypothetical protein